MESKRGAHEGRRGSWRVVEGVLEGRRGSWIEGGEETKDDRDIHGEWNVGEGAGLREERK